MPKKRSISQLILDEVEQQELFNLDAYTSHKSDWQLDTCSGAEIYNRKTTPQKFVLEQTLAPAPEQTTPAPEQKHWLETYTPSTRKNYSYYRYVWMQGRKLLHLHLPGGNTKNPKAIALYGKVSEAIALGKTPQEIVKLIKEGLDG